MTLDELEKLADESPMIVTMATQHLKHLIALMREMGELRKDAERYRHVRANPAMLLHLRNSEFDAAIDDAMKGTE